MDPTEFIPWPVQLGVAGGAVAMVIGLLIWLVRSFVRGTFVTKEQSDARAAAELKAHNAALVAIDAAHALALKALTDSSDSRIGDQSRRGDEWKETALIERQGRLEQTGLVAELVDAIPRLDEYVAANPPGSPSLGDNGSTEVSVARR